MKLRPSDPHPTFIRKLRLSYIYSLVNKILKVPFDQCFHFNCDTNSLPEGNEQIDLITVAFNNLHVLKHHIYSFKKMISDTNYVHLIADNSSNPEKSREIEEFCRNEKVAYVRLPKSSCLDKKYVSYSHGAALNWLYCHYVSARKAKYFAFLDHDIYPTKKISIKEKIGDQHFYGYKRGDAERWYLWAGLAFFEYSFISQVKANFLPCKIGDIYYDTGSSLCLSLFSKSDGNKLFFPEFKRICLKELGYDNDSNVEFIDDCWFHSANGSYWRSVQNYDSIIDQIIKKMQDK